MKCLEQGHFALYFYDLLEPEESAAIAIHLQNCSHCEALLRDFVDELDDPEEWRVIEEPTPSVVQEIIARTPSYPLQVLKRLDIHKKKTPNPWIKRSINLMKKITFAAAGTAAVIYFGTLVSPTFATYVNGFIATTGQPQQESSLFSQMKSPELEYYQPFVQAGYTKKVDLIALDKEMTLEVKEVMADTRNVRVIFGVKDASGKQINKLHSAITTKGAKPAFQINITDEDGKSYHSSGELTDAPREHEIKFLGKDEEFIMIGQPINTLFTDTNQIPDQLNIDFSITEINKTTGNWKVSIPVDISKAKKETKIIPINQQYKFPAGDQLDLKQIITTPAHTEVVLEHKLSEKRSISSYGYEITDGQGTRFYKNSRLNNTLKRHAIWQTDGSLLTFDVFKPLSAGKELTFKVSSTFDFEPATFEKKLVLSELKNNSITAEKDGNSFTFSKFQIDEKVEQGGAKERYASIRLDTTYASGIVEINSWVAKDDKGNKYPISYRSTPTLNDNGIVTESGTLHLSEPLKGEIKELTLSYDKVRKEIKGDYWSVPIPIK